MRGRRGEGVEPLTLLAPDLTIEETEVLVAVLERLGIQTGIDLYKMMDIAEEIVAPILPQPQEINRDSLTLGYTGVY